MSLIEQKGKTIALNVFLRAGAIEIFSLVRIVKSMGMMIKGPRSQREGTAGEKAPLTLALSPPHRGEGDIIARISDSPPVQGGGVKAFGEGYLVDTPPRGGERGQAARISDSGY